MNIDTMACVAFIAGRIISGRNAQNIYDYSQLKYRSINGSISYDSVIIFDYERGCHFSGTPPRLYDYGTRAHIQLNISGNQFNGYDYGGGNHFSGSVNGGNITLYDYGKGQHFSYSL